MSRLLDIALFVGQRLFWLGNGAALALAFGPASAARPQNNPLSQVVQAAPAPAPIVPAVHVHVATPTAAVAPAAPATAPIVLPPLRLSDQAMERGCRKARQFGVAGEDLGFFISREEVDSTLENQATLMRAARIVPEVRDGKTVGIRMFGVRAGSQLARLGFENGDTLISINGFDVTVPEKALEAYARLRSTDRLTVLIERRGLLTRLDYFIC